MHTNKTQIRWHTLKSAFVAAASDEPKTKNSLSVVRCLASSPTSSLLRAAAIDGYLDLGDNVIESRFRSEREERILSQNN